MRLQQDPTAPPEIEEVIVPTGVFMPASNVIMQLARLPVGRGVAESKVHSGKLEYHPIKRARTTGGYLAIALFGSEEDRRLLRAEIDKSHRAVRSGPEDEVAYSAFDPELQLWIAACLYKGFMDVYRDTWGELPPDRADAVYEYCAVLGTTLQVREEMWPATREEFDRYWDAAVADISMDEVTRTYLRDFARVRFLGPLSWLIGPLVEFAAVGYLPQEFRDELGLPWDTRREWAFRRSVKLAAAVSRVTPRPLRLLPIQLYAADARRRLRSGKAFV